MVVESNKSVPLLLLTARFNIFMLSFTHADHLIPATTSDVLLKTNLPNVNNDHFLVSMFSLLLKVSETVVVLNNLMYHKGLD